VFQTASACGPAPPEISGVPADGSIVRVSDFGGHQLQQKRPTHPNGVGDFDGDGVDDVFLATGAAWYYSPRGKAEWRYLAGGRTDRIESLLFGDFDGDGRTDVVGKNGNDLMVSWGGISAWERLNTTSAPISDLAIGDFNDDGFADILWADGTTANWYRSSAGSGPFLLANTSSRRVSELRFGHFSICGGGHETDVFGMNGGRWSVSCGAISPWASLLVSLTNSIDNSLFVADFDGNGYAGVARATPPINLVNGVIGWMWQLSPDGTQDWSSHQNYVTSTSACNLTFPDVWNAGVVGIGRFDETKKSDILLWGDAYHNNFCIVPGGTGSAQRQSRQDMR